MIQVFTGACNVSCGPVLSQINSENALGGGMKHDKNIYTNNLKADKKFFDIILNKHF